MKGDYEPQTKKHDMDFYPQLKAYNINDIEFIELEYGTMFKTFENLKSYSVNTTTKELECIYFTSEELEEMEQNAQDIHHLAERSCNISNYLDENPNSMSDIENYILQNELNKITEGMN
jgi:hypothetical protein